MNGGQKWKFVIDPKRGNGKMIRFVVNTTTQKGKGMEKGLRRDM